MKKLSKKVLYFICAALVLILCASLLFACNTEKKRLERERQERQKSAYSVEEAFLNGLDEDWTRNMRSGDIALLDKAGDYIVVEGWTHTVCDVLVKSDLQTAKIKALAEAIRSESGKKLIADFGANAELILPLLKQVDLTPDDISFLVYDMLCALVKEGGSTLNGMLARLNEVKALAISTPSTVANIDAQIASINTARSSLVPTAAEAEAMLDAFADAKQPLEKLVSFAYNMSINAISDNMYDAIFAGNGALTDISQSEIATLISTLLVNVTELKTSLDDSAVASLNRAFSLVIDKFDSDDMPSSLYAQIVKYAKYAYMTVDVIPALCDVVNAAGDVLTKDDFLAQIMSFIAVGEDMEDGMKEINTSIIAAKVMLGVTEKFGENELCAIIEKICAQAATDHQKTSPVILLDLALNLSSAFGESGDSDLQFAHPEHMTVDKVNKMIATLFFNANFERFKETYRNFGRGLATLSQLRIAAENCSFATFDIINPYSIAVANPDYISAEDLQRIKNWRDYYVSVAESKVNETVKELSADIREDLTLFIREFYAEGSASGEAMREMAGWSLFTQSPPEQEADVWMDKMRQSNLMGIWVLLAILFPN